MAPNKKGSRLDIEKQFTFYAAYHNNEINKYIHILFVWPILFTALVLLWQTPELYPLPFHMNVKGVEPKLNWALVTAVQYIVFYLALEVKNLKKLTGVGLFAALLVAALYFVAGYLHNLGSVHIPLDKGYDVDVWKLATGVHVTSWVAQFIGHGVFEGRAPALLDNLFQAVFMAPIFILLELVFAVGLKKKLHKSIHTKTQTEIAAWKATQQVKNTPGRVTRSKSKKL